MAPLYAGIEAGGTKFVCALGTGPRDIRAITRIPTTTPTETLAAVVSFFRQQQHRHGRLTAFGVASFGPVDLDPGSPFFGSITSTPKPGWAHTPILRTLGDEFGVPVAFDTDVNAAAFGEWTWGAGQQHDTLLYLTVGTGIGGGVLVRGRPLHGLVHPEIGHILVPHDHTADPFRGACPFHGDCLEGLASGPAMQQRWGRPAHELPIEHPAWDLEAHYLALALANCVCTLSPQRIILGGGVMEQAHLFPRIRHRLAAALADYIVSPSLQPPGLADYVVPPALGERAGVLGALALAATATERP